MNVLDEFKNYKRKFMQNMNEKRLNLFLLTLSLMIDLTNIYLLEIKPKNLRK